MVANAFRMALIHFAVLLSLSACNIKSKPEPIYSAIAMETLAESSTSTTTHPLKETGIPKPKVLSGIVMISDNDNKPFVTPIELRGKNNFSLYKTVITDAEGKFEFLDIPPGDYELWVLITTETKMVSGCEDLLVPNNQWKIGIKFQEGDPIIIGETSLHKAILGSQNFNVYDLQPAGFYAVSPDFTIVSVFDENIEIAFSCK